MEDRIARLERIVESHDKDITLLKADNAALKEAVATLKEDIKSIKAGQLWAIGFAFSTLVSVIFLLLKG